MANLYADENYPFEVVVHLRQLGHDVVTAQEAGQAYQGIPDPRVLAFAIGLSRAVLTCNRRDFIKLHKRTPSHKGIVVCTYDDDFLALAQRIDRALLAAGPLDNQLIRVNKPARPTKP